MATDIIEPLLESMKIVSESILQGLSYDITVPCNIVDASQRNNGEYKVSNGTATFIAYSENTEYREDQTVYVKIPQGDYNNDKIITGRKKDKDSVEPYIYHNPIDTILDITGNIDPNDKQFGLIANDINQSIQVLDLRFSKPYYNFERLAIRAGFRSWLSDLNCVRGDYGLKLEIEFKPQSIDSAAAAHNYTKTLYLNTSDMIGDVYSFDNFFQQSKVFDISQEAGIIAIKGWFYQDSNFIDASGNKIPYLDEFEQPILSNLFINGIEIILGYDYTNYNQEFVKLFTFSNTIYGPNRPNDQKTVELKWVHIEDNGNRIVMKPEVDGNYEIRWYRYVLGSPSDDSYSGIFYKRINPANGEVWSEGAAAKSFTCVFTPDSTANEEEKIKAVILFGDEPKIYRSDVLTFTNSSQILNAPTLDAVRAVNLECDDLSYGNYYVYDEGNGLLPNFNKMQSHAVVCKFNLSATGETHNDFNDLTSTDSIIWKVPNKNTMLTIDENQTFDYGSKSVSSDNSYTTFTVSNLTNLGSADNQKSPTLKYSIKSYYSAAANNNTITCIIKKGGVEYTGLLTFSFGQAGTTGTDYTLVLEFEDNNFNAITLRTTNKFNVRAFLYDQNNELQKLDGTTIDFKWKDSNSKAGYSMSWQKASDGYSYICEILVNSNANINDILILQATLNGWGDYNLISYLPIPIKIVANSYVIGADKVVYSTSGNPSYYKNPYEYYEDNKKINVVWNSKAVDELNDNKFLPSIKVKNNNGINEYRLKPKSLYIDGLKPYAVQAIYNNQVIWAQPILIIQNEYFSSTINKWDGALTINENESYILSKMIGAGKKNNNNQFTGVLMGDWGNKANANDPTLTNYTGLFGFQNGVMTYAFKDDGTGFIGSGTSRIDFNDSNNNFISTNIFNLRKESPYFTINNVFGKELLNIGDSSYYLKSANYADIVYNQEITSGAFIDLQDGQMIINSGIFNQDISIPYGGDDEDGKKKIKKLSDILDELYNATDDADTVASKAQRALKQVKAQVKELENQQAELTNIINTISDFLSIGIIDNKKDVVQLTTPMYNGYVQVGDAVTIYGNNGSQADILLTGDVYINGTLTINGRKI